MLKSRNALKGEEVSTRVFAYGSNTNTAQMLRRCPRAKLIGPGELVGHRLAFVGFSQSWGGSVATIEPAAKAKVPGLIWSLNDADMERLDRFEGAPFVYRRVLAQNREPKRNVLEVYVHTRPIIGVPSAAYIATIRAGYAAAKLDLRHLENAVRRAKRAVAREQRELFAA